MNRIMARPISEVGPRPSRMAQEGRSRSNRVPGWVRDLVDRWRHPEEGSLQRSRRRYLAALPGSGSAYVLSAARVVEEPGEDRILFPWEGRPQIVGVRIVRE